MTSPTKMSKLHYAYHEVLAEYAAKVFLAGVFSTISTIIICPEWRPEFLHIAIWAVVVFASSMFACFLAARMAMKVVGRIDRHITAVAIQRLGEEGINTKDMSGAITSVEKGSKDEKN